MKASPPWIMLMFLSLSLMICCNEIDLDEVERYLDTGKEIVDILDKGVSAIEAFGSVAGTSGNYLEAVEWVVKIILGIIPTSGDQSQEVEQLRQLSETINTRLDDIDSQLSDIQKLVEFSTILSPYLYIASDVRALYTVYEELFTLPSSVTEDQKEIFIKTYENDYHNSGIKLFQGFNQDQGPFGGKLIDSAMSFYNNDRRKMASFMTTMTKLMFMASQMEIGYFASLGFDNATIDNQLRLWEYRFNQTAFRMKLVDQEIESKWKDQYPKDIEKFMLQNRTEKMSIISDSLYQMLSMKYYWRDWIVIISDHVNNQYDRNQICGGYSHTTKNGLDVVVTSMPLENSTIDENDVNRMAQSLRKTYKSRGGNADQVFSWITPSISDNCTDYGAVGIIYGNKNVNFNARFKPECLLHPCWDKHYGCVPTAFERLYIYVLADCGSYYAYFFG